MPFLQRVLAILTGQLYTVRGDSMIPTFHRGDLLLVNRRAYREQRPARGDVVITLDPIDPSRRYLKRVIGLPGEEVRLLDGMLFIDEEHLHEPYLGGLPASPGLGRQVWKLGMDDYFLMGDNRAHSTDSRGFGPVGLRLIVGLAWIRCWPLNRWGRWQ